MFNAAPRPCDNQVMPLDPVYGRIRAKNLPVPGPRGPGGVSVVLLHPRGTASAAAALLAAGAFSAVSDPDLRAVVRLTGFSKVRVHGRLGGVLVGPAKLRVQYHPGGDPAVASGDAGWATLADSAGSHSAGAMFYSAEVALPAGALVDHCLLRAGLYDGDGLASPTIMACVVSLYA